MTLVQVHTFEPRCEERAGIPPRLQARVRLNSHLGIPADSLGRPATAEARTPPLVTDGTRPLEEPVGRAGGYLPCAEYP